MEAKKVVFQSAVKTFSQLLKNGYILTMTFLSER